MRPRRTKKQLGRIADLIKKSNTSGENPDNVNSEDDKRQPLQTYKQPDKPTFTPPRSHSEDMMFASMHLLAKEIVKLKAMLKELKKKK